MRRFERYIGIDYSGARTPASGLPGLRVYSATSDKQPTEILPLPGRTKYWTRRALTEWLVIELRRGPRTFVGIDHAFSFPLRFFEVHGLSLDWETFLDDFVKHWPTDGDDVWVDSVRRGMCGNAASRTGNPRWRRITEERCGAKSVFHFDVQGSVAKSTHAGLPWLRFLRRQLSGRVHFWPFDGWNPSSECSVVAEVYPSLWSGMFDAQGRTSDQQDAYCVARWMRQNDAADGLEPYFHPQISRGEREAVEIEGWIFGLL